MSEHTVHIVEALSSHSSGGSSSSDVVVNTHYVEQQTVSSSMTMTVSFATAATIEEGRNVLLENYDKNSAPSPQPLSPSLRGTALLRPTITPSSSSPKKNKVPRTASQLKSEIDGTYWSTSSTKRAAKNLSPYVAPTTRKTKRSSYNDENNSSAHNNINTITSTDNSTYDSTNANSNANTNIMYNINNTSNTNTSDNMYNNSINNNENNYNNENNDNNNIDNTSNNNKSSSSHHIKKTDPSKTKKRRSLETELDGSYWSRLGTPQNTTTSSLLHTPSSLPAILSSLPSSTSSLPPSTSPSPQPSPNRKSQKTNNNNNNSNNNDNKKKKKKKHISPRKLFDDDVKTEFVTTNDVASSTSVAIVNEGVPVDLDGEYWSKFDPNATRRKPRQQFEAVDDQERLYWEARNIKKKVPKKEVVLTEEQKQQKILKKQQKREERHKQKMETDQRLRDKKKNSKLGKEIFPGLYLGGKKVAKNLNFLSNQNIKFIVNVTKEVSNFHTACGISYKRIEITDSHDSNLHHHFPSVTKSISEGLKYGNVLVHCQEGKSRSPTVIIAYAMQALGKTLQEAYKQVEIHQPEININQGFQRQLIKYENELKGSCSFDFTTRKSNKAVKQLEAEVATMEQ